MIYLKTNISIRLTLKKRTETRLTHVDHNQLSPLPLIKIKTPYVLFFKSQSACQPQKN